MEEKLSSPIPKKKPVPSPMSFAEAMAQVKAGRRISRLAWNTSEEYGLLKDGWLMIYRNNEFFRWVISDGDILSDDWISLPDAN